MWLIVSGIIAFFTVIQLFKFIISLSSDDTRKRKEREAVVLLVMVAASCVGVLGLLVGGID